MATQRRIPGIPGNAHTSEAQRHRAKSGSSAEERVDRLNETCARAGMAWIHRVSNHVRITKNLGGGRVMGVMVRKSVVDLMGHTADGRVVCADVKHVAVSRLNGGGEAAWRLPLDRIEEHQRAMLATCHRAGGVAFVLVVHGEHAYPVPWSVVADAFASGAASLSRDVIEPYRADPSRPYLAALLTPRATRAQ
jgi:penicillin-binding protein-related factor A (putative recombinase)